MKNEIVYDEDGIQIVRGEEGQTYVRLDPSFGGTTFNQWIKEADLCLRFDTHRDGRKLVGLTIPPRNS